MQNVSRTSERVGEKPWVRISGRKVYEYDEVNVTRVVDLETELVKRY